METPPKKPIYKRWWFWLVAALVVLIAIGRDFEEQPEADNQAPATELVSFETLREWQPGPEPNAVGLDILLPDSVTEKQIETLVRHLARDTDESTIRGFTSKQAFEEVQDPNAEMDAAKSGYLFFYRKALAGITPYQGEEIRWMQQEGRFSDKHGEKTVFQ